MGLGISWFIDPSATQFSLRTCGRIHRLLKFLADGEKARQEIHLKVSSLQFSSGYLAKALVLGWVERRKSERRVYYRLTQVGKQALECLEKVDPVDLNKPIPLEGYHLVKVPIRLSQRWYTYFLERAW